VRRQPFNGLWTKFSLLVLFAAAYIDDVVIFSRTWPEHLQHIRAVFNELKKAGLKVKGKKCQFAMHSCEYLGHVVGGQSIRPHPLKIDAIKNFQRPRTKKQVRAFLGLLGYYRKFIPNFAQLSASLSDLTRKDLPNQIQWTETLQTDFESLKSCLMSESVLICPDYTKEFIIQTDASGRGIGGVLSQLDQHNEERPIAFYSRKLLERERRYSAIELECLGIISTLKHFQVYLLGRKFAIHTDHQALQYLQKMKNTNSRLTRWAMALQPFDFSIAHRDGRDNGNADGLSRQGWKEDNLPDEGEPGKNFLSSLQLGKGEMLGKPP